MKKEVFLKDLKKGDIIKGVKAPIEVVMIRGYMYFLYNIKTRQFFDVNWKEMIRRDARVEIF